MDLFAPIAQIPLERFAELSAELAEAEQDPAKTAEILLAQGVSTEDWNAARAGWTERIHDPVRGSPVAVRYSTLFHAALDRRKGPPPDISFEDFAALWGEALATGLPAMWQRQGITPFAWSRMSFRWISVIAQDPSRFMPFIAAAEQHARRLTQGAAPPPVVHVAMPPEPAPAAAPTAEPPKQQGFEQDASVAAKAVGKAMVSGFNAFGSALDSLGKSILGPSVGQRVLVAWSDGNKYPGTVAQVGKGQYLITMPNGSQHWVAEAYIRKE